MSLPKDINYRLTPVQPSEVPDMYRRSPVSERNKKLLDDFLLSGAEVCRVDADWPTETTHGDVSAFQSSLKAIIKAADLPIHCFRRQGEVYLAKKKGE